MPTASTRLNWTRERESETRPAFVAESIGAIDNGRPRKPDYRDRLPYRGNSAEGSAVSAVRGGDRDVM